MANVIVKMSGIASASSIKASLKSDKRGNKLSNFLSGLVESLGGSGANNANIQILNGDDVAASATVTTSFAHQTANDTIQIGALTLTAVASGATGPQFNIGASNSASAANLSSAINANSSGLLVAAAAGAVVTVSATTSGPIGNAIPIILTQTDSAGMTASATALSGGANDTSTPQSYRSF